MSKWDIDVIKAEIPGAAESMAYPASVLCSECQRMLVPEFHGEYKRVIVEHPIVSDCSKSGKKYGLAPFPVVTVELESLDWIKNVRINYKTKKRIYNPLSRKLWNDKAVIVGACPSLDNQKERLPKMKEDGYTIVCLMRALPCIKDLVDPDIVVIVDAVNNFDEYYKMAHEKSALIASLMASPSLIENWPGPIYGVVPAENRMCNEELANYARDMQLPRVWTFQLSASFCSILARIMGISPEYMGCDMWFTKDQYYAKPYTDKHPEDDIVLKDNRYPGTYRLTSQRFLDKQKQADMIEGYFRINCENLRRQIVD